jgi:hypothetical protein
MRNPFGKIKDWYYNIKRGVPNLIIWFPTIWQDRSWDHYFIWAMLHRKLVIMEKHIRNHSHHLHRKRDADQIKIAVILLKRLLDNNYHDNVFRNHDKKWGESHFNWKETNEFYSDTHKEKLYSLDITRDNANTEKEKKQERKEFRILSKKVAEVEQQDINYLFEYMAKHIQGWWD